MSLKYKTLLVVLGCIAAMLAVTGYATRYVVLRQFRQLEDDRTHLDVREAHRLVRSMIEEFAQRAQDWSDWDDLAEHLNDGNVAFQESNASVASLETVGFDVFVVVRADGLRRTSVMLDEARHAFVPVASEIDALIDSGRLRSETLATWGLQRVGNQVMLVVSRSVCRSDRSAPKTPGWMVVGKRLDRAWTERFRRYSSQQIEFISAGAEARDSELALVRSKLSRDGDTHLVERPNGLLVGYTLLTDFAGQPVLDLRLTRQPELSAAGTRTLNLLTKMNAISGVLFALLAVSLMHRGVLRPLASLSRGVEHLRQGNWSTVTANGRDETADLARAFNQMARTLVEREESLKLVLDNVGDGLVNTSPSGHIVGNVSAPAAQWFGVPGAEVTLWDWLGAEGKERDWFRSGYEQLVDGFLPYRLLVEQMPRTAVRDERTYELNYREVLGSDTELIALLVIIRDITTQLEQGRAEEQSREMQLAMGNWLHNRSGFARCIEECQRLVSQVCSSEDAEARRRDLHTLKGTAAACGVLRVAKLCHQIEDELAAESSSSVVPQVAALRTLWQASLENIRGFLINDVPVVDLPLQEYEQFLSALAEGCDHGLLLAQARTWRQESLEQLLQNLAASGDKLARRLRKQVTVTVQHGGLRVKNDGVRHFVSSLVHVVNNAIDHGIESPEERREGGKPSVATLAIEAALRDGSLVFSIRDDGRGIVWDRLRDSALRAGLQATTEAELVRAMFTSGVTTKHTVTEVSGRGVGLEATYHAMLDLGGTCQILTEAGVGSTFEFAFPFSDGVVCRA